MIDIVDTTTRSRMMAGIKGSDTKPEIRVRRYLHACGFRFRLHRRDLPGRPDLVLPKYHLAIFVHGCFWHRHAGCAYASTPSTRPGFWQKKFAANIARDQRNIDNLMESGWRVFVLWECGLMQCFEQLDKLPRWIVDNITYVEWPLEIPKPSEKSTLSSGYTQRMSGELSQHEVFRLNKNGH